jgi:hypothetical protein
MVVGGGKQHYKFQGKPAMNYKRPNVRAMTQKKKNIFDNILRKQRAELKLTRDMYAQTAKSFYETNPQFSDYLGRDEEGLVNIGDTLEKFVEYNKISIPAMRPNKNIRRGFINFILGFKKFKGKYSPLMILIFILTLVIAGWGDGAHMKTYSNLIPGSVVGIQSKYTGQRKNRLERFLQSNESGQNGGFPGDGENIESLLLNISDGRRVLEPSDFEKIVDILIQTIVPESAAKGGRRTRRQR